MPGLVNCHVDSRPMLASVDVALGILQLEIREQYFTLFCDVL